LAGATLAIFLAAVLARHISYAFGSLPERLRRSQYGPLRGFLTVAICDALALTLCVTLLRSWRQPSEVNWAEARTTALELFNTPHQVTDIAGLTVLQIGIALIGLLYYIAVVKSGSGRKQFHRTDGDIRALANLSISAGNVTQARAWIKREQSHNFESYLINARIALSEGEFSEAAASMRRSLRARDEDDSSDSVNIALISLATLTGTSSLIGGSFIPYLIDANSSDAIISMALDNPILLGNEPEKLAEDLLEVCPEASFPLARSLLMVYLHKIGEAIAMLGRARPGSEIEELTRLIWQCMFVLIDPDVTVADTRSYIDKWFDESYPTVREIAHGMEGAYRKLALGRLVFLQVIFTSFTEEYKSEEQESKDKSHAQLLLELASQLADSDEEVKRFRTFYLKRLTSQEAFQSAST
jgi:hypothetical protein